MLSRLSSKRRKLQAASAAEPKVEIKPEAVRDGKVLEVVAKEVAAHCCGNIVDGPVLENFPQKLEWSSGCTGSGMDYFVCKDAGFQLAKSIVLLPTYQTRQKCRA